MAEFDWDGEQIKNFTVSSASENFGVTSLDYAFTFPGAATRRCSRTLQQVSAAGGSQLSPTSFQLSMSADDPLVYPRAPGSADASLVPNIDSNLVGAFGADGNLTIAYDTDRFPSHGFRVTVDGTDRETQVTNDVSCLDETSVQGLFGVGLLGTALSLHDNVGSLVVDPAQPPRSSSRPGAVCSSDFLTVDWYSYGASIIGRAASVASTLRLAPLDGAGKPGAFVTLDKAVAQGLVSRHELSSSRVVLGVNPARPVVVRANGSTALTTTRLANGKPGSPVQYGPVKGKVEAALTLTPRDRSGIQTTIATLKGKRLKLRSLRFRVAKRDLAQVRVFSIDVVGNAEKAKRLRLR